MALTQRFAAVCLLCAVLAGTAIAQSPELHGYVKFFAHPNLRQSRFDRAGARLQASLSHHAGDHLSAFASFDINVEETRNRGSDERSAATELYPVELYVQFDWEKLALRVGKQFIFWGKTDWINPTDNITPWDFANIDAELEDYRLAVTGIKANWYPGNWDVEMIVTPVFQPNRIPMRIPDMIGSVPTEVRKDLPGFEVKNMQYGVRASSYVSGFDYSLSYWNGFDLFPSLYVSLPPTSHPGTNSVRFQYAYYRVQVFGFDFARSFGAWMVKGEGAYFRTADATGTDPYITNPHFKYVLGVDWYPSDDIVINGQFIQDILFKYSRDYELLQLGPFVSAFHDVPGKVTNSASLRVQYDASDSWNVQLIGVVNLRDVDFFLLPIVNYSPYDGVNVYAGATTFFGPDESPFGRTKDFSRAFLEVKYSY